jgi:alpha-1,3-mannosyltransferase
LDKAGAPVVVGKVFVGSFASSENVLFSSSFGFIHILLASLARIAMPRMLASISNMLQIHGSRPFQIKRILMACALVTTAFLFWLRFNDYSYTPAFVQGGVSDAPGVPADTSRAQLPKVPSAVSTTGTNAIVQQSLTAEAKPLDTDPKGTQEKAASERGIYLQGGPSFKQVMLIRTVQNATLLALAPKYHKAILDPEDVSFPRLECPPVTQGRYDYMRSTLNTTSSSPQRTYFFAINLHDSIEILPRLLGSIIETIRFLGVTRCTLSIIEGRSTDGTFEILNSLQEDLKNAGISYHFASRDENPEDGDRIGKLAALRNAALAPLRKDKSLYENATIIFLNDVAICIEDILELIHQRAYLGADMVCGMDWKNLWRDPTFYDVWIARTLTGDSFFEVGADGNWDSAWNLFASDENSRQRFNNHVPIQVFSCWNGGAVFGARPLFETEIAFRGPRETECFNGEPSIFCKELWWYGYGKIAVVPSVNLEYSDEGAKLVRELRGTPSKFPVEGEESRLEWQKEPPEKVRCITNYDRQTWGPWNESMAEAPTHS